MLVSLDRFITFPNFLILLVTQHHKIIGENTCFELYVFQLVVKIILIDLTCLKHQGSAWGDDKIVFILKNSNALILAR
jgi:hypothetical protein